MSENPLSFTDIPTVDDLYPSLDNRDEDESEDSVEEAILGLFSFFFGSAGGNHLKGGKREHKYRSSDESDADERKNAVFDSGIPFDEIKKYIGPGIWDIREIPSRITRDIGDFFLGEYRIQFPRNIDEEERDERVHELLLTRSHGFLIPHGRHHRRSDIDEVDDREETDNHLGRMEDLESPVLDLLKTIPPSNRTIRDRRDLSPPWYRRYSGK